MVPAEGYQHQGTASPRNYGVADAESREMIDCSDWKLNPDIFKRIEQIWHPIEVDEFPPD